MPLEHSGKMVQNPSSIAEVCGSARHLDGALAHSIAWTSSVKWFIQLLTWISTLFVARILTPEDYGLVAMASIYIGLVGLINEFGLGAAVVVLPDLSHDDLSQINGLAVLLGVVSFAFSCVVALPLGWFFNAPGLPWVVMAISGTFLFTGFRTVPAALLTKDLRFKRLALFEAAQAVLLSLSVIVFALLGLKYWTLVLGRVLGEVISTGLMVVWRPHPLAFPRKSVLNKALTFSWHIVVGRFCWFVYSNADFVITGRILGQAALGFYTFSWTLANIPIEKVTALVGRVTPAFFSTVQTEKSALRRYLLIITEGLAVTTFPMTFGIALVADDFVYIALGGKWVSVIEPLRLLAFYASFRSIVTLLPQVLNVIQESRFTMWNGVVAATVLPVAFYMGSSYGTVGIAAAWIAVHPFVTVPLYWRVFRTIKLTPTDYLRSLWPSIAGAIVMAVAVWSLQYTLPSDWPRPVRFSSQVVGGGVAYVGVITMLCRGRLIEFYRNFRVAVA